MRPLELVIYDEYHGVYSRQQMIDGVNHISFHMPKPKHFTEAELAAEYWQAESDCWEADAGNEILNAGDPEDVSVTFRLFATHPHYTDAD